MFTAVGFGGVANHFVPVTVVEVHVDIRHRFSARVQETFKKQVVFDRVEICDL